MGCSGNTSSTNSAALSAMRLAPQLGQNPRRDSAVYKERCMATGP